MKNNLVYNGNMAHKSLPGNLKLLDYEESKYDRNVFVFLKEWDIAIVADIWFRLYLFK